jgi:2-keto-3-deoxy-L-rhamnonate aldolase RhmA
MPQFVKGRMKKLLSEHKLTFGTWISLTDSDVVDMLGHVGFDWFVFDTEHSPLNTPIIQKLIQPLSSTEVSPLIRVAWNDPVLIKLALDVGAEGVVVPWVNTVEDAVRAVKACRYPPYGIRGFGPRRAAAYGLDPTYAKRANESIAVIVQIETEEAIKNAPEILKVDGVDAYFIGPYDLSCSLGVPGEFESEKFKNAIDAVLKAGKQADKPGGIWTDDPQTAVKRIKQGFKMIDLSGDIGILLRAAKEWLEIVKKGTA